MQLQAMILAEHSKANCDRIVKWIGGSQERFNELIRLFLGDDQLIAQRAAWPLSYSSIAHPELVKKHLPKLLKNLDNPKRHEGVIRNTLRLLEEISVPERLEGDLMNRCFNYISDPAAAAAVKASSLTVLQNLSKKYPEIRPEILTIIDERWDHEGAAVRSRARAIRKDFSRKKADQKNLNATN